MASAERGRFCASCQKTVIDYSILTDDEIIARLKALKNTPSCGHFHESQLGRELVATRRINNFPRLLLNRMAASLLFFQTIAATAWAQTANHTTTQHAKKLSAKKHTHSRAINGKVIDYATNEKLHGITVQIKGTEIEAITDKSGSFSLALPNSFKVTKLTLYASYTVLSVKEPDGTTIMSEDIDLDSLPAEKQVVLYRYPKDESNPAIVKAYKRPLIVPNEGDHFFRGDAANMQVSDLLSIKPPGVTGGARVINDYSAQQPPEETKSPPVRKIFWQRITSPFRKKENRGQ
jgi:hypothetical protein